MKKFLTCFCLLFFIFCYQNGLALSERAGAHIVAHSYELSGDGVLTSGETCDLSLTIENIGDAPTNAAITVNLTSNNNALTIVQGTAIYNSVDPGQLLTLADGFTIAAATSVFNGQTFTITVTASCGGESWESSIVVTVYKPIVELHHVAWTGDFSAGGQIEVLVFFENIGGVIATNAMGELSSPTSYITINNPEQSIGDIYPSGITAFVFNISIGMQVPPTIDFEIDFTSENGISLSEDFSISNGCNIIVDLHDSWGDGWNYAELLFAFSNGWSSQSFTISSGSEESFSIEMVSNVTVTVSFVSGSYDSECSFEIYYEGGDMIYQSSGTPQEGVVTTFVTDCGSEPIDCAPISDFSAVNSGSNVTLNWSAAPSNSYQIRRDGMLIATAMNTSYTDVNVPVGDHYYCVYAVCGSELSAPLCEMVTVYSSCFPPESLTATVESDHVNLDWDAVEEAESYQIFRNGSFIQTTTETSFSDIHLAEGTYCYTVATVCTNGTSEPSEEACASIASCVAPYDLSTSTNGVHIDLLWSASTTAESYNVYRNGELIADDLFSTNYTDENVAIGTHCYTVTAVCADNEESEPSNESCEVITSIEELQEDFKVYPNPVQSLLTIEGTNIKTVSVFNIVGQLMGNYSASSDKMEIDLQSYDAGAYFLKILTPSGFEITKRIVVSK